MDLKTMKKEELLKYAGDLEVQIVEAIKKKDQAIDDLSKVEGKYFECNKELKTLNGLKETNIVLEDKVTKYEKEMALLKEELGRLKSGSDGQIKNLEAKASFYEKRAEEITLLFNDLNNAFNEQSQLFDLFKKQSFYIKQTIEMKVNQFNKGDEK